MFSYRSILKQAWFIAWKNKHLWFFGLFASLAVAGGSMEYQFMTQSTSQGLINGSYGILNKLLALSDLFQQIGLGLVTLFHQDFFTILNTITITLLTLTIICLFIWLAISSQAALVDSIKKLMSPKKKADSLSIRSGLTAGSQHFWSVLGLNIFIKVLIGFAFFIVSLPLLFLALSDQPSFIIAYTILFVIFVPIAVSLSLIIKYAISCRVLENKSVVASLTYAWHLFKKNWLISLEVALLLFIVSFLASALLLIIIGVFFFPLLWFSLAFSLGGMTVIIILLALILAALFGSLFTTFQVSAWTDLYLQLKANKGKAKLERVFQKK
ncbi:MAG: hypothetical protein WC467_00060 [Patescibacteria group bacterium]